MKINFILFNLIINMVKIIEIYLFIYILTLYKLRHLDFAHSYMLLLLIFKIVHRIFLVG